MAHKVLITEPINEKVIDFLRGQGYELVMGTGPSEETLLKELAGCDGALTRNGKFTRKVFETFPQLKVVSMHGVGVDGIDVDAATEHGVQITNANDSNSTSVAEYAICMLLMMAKHMETYVEGTKAGKKDDVRKVYGNDVRGKTLGLVGWGKIGKKVVDIASKGLGMKVIAYNRHITENQEQDFGHLTPNMKELFANADFISLHLPGSAATHHMINAELIGLMKPTAYLINCGRGEVVDEAALIEALKARKIQGAALDVVETNLPADDNPLLKMDNVIVTPHTAAFTTEALENMAYQAALGVYETLEGKPVTFPINKLGR